MCATSLRQVVSFCVCCASRLVSASLISLQSTQQSDLSTWVTSLRQVVSFCACCASSLVSASLISLHSTQQSVLSMWVTSLRQVVGFCACCASALLISLHSIQQPASRIWMTSGAQVVSMQGMPVCLPVFCCLPMPRHWSRLVRIDNALISKFLCFDSATVQWLQYSMHNQCRCFSCLPLVVAV